MLWLYFELSCCDLLNSSLLWFKELYVDHSRPVKSLFTLPIPVFQHFVHLLPFSLSNFVFLSDHPCREASEGEVPGQL